ncbi:MAG: PEGA domain-containing protein [Candidatus Eisenbacteria bacterium]|uniref:PEGA domain-containing protein n=1 Tax=Eiseniibacteriota bacterium TaxID=2212470 RepID=A0A9D6L5I2_UNCEI|nr:PEGA domain-containing protein [Candidatus Eisenbacteria bacterium]MBI3538996.1 PEGA domain-containing protein [Candidatus Eisenbacteria bacterium]
MTSVADPTLYWAVLSRSRGEILTAEAQSPGLHLGILGIPAGLAPRDVEGWLYDIIGVAHEGSPVPESAGRIPPLLRHALTGLVFSHAELWDRRGGPRPCSFAFAHTVHEVGFGVVGDVDVAVAVDGVAIEPQWISVRDEGGRAARAWNIGSDHSIQVRIDWRPQGGEGGEVEAVWSAARPAPARAVEPAHTMRPAREPEPAPVMAREPVATTAPEPPPAAPTRAWPSMPEHIPPTPEPPALTAQTATWHAPPDPHVIDLPASVPPRITPSPGDEDAGDIEFHTISVERPRHATPADATPADAPPAGAPPADAPPADAPRETPVLRLAPPARPASIASAPAAAKRPARRLVFQTTERRAWPTWRGLMRGDHSFWRRASLWMLALAALFAAGWGLGALQDNTGPRDVSHQGMIGAALHALGLGGPRFRVDVSSRPGDAWIAVDGRSLSLRTPAAIELAPGEHRVTLSYPDRGGATFTVRGSRGDRVPLEGNLWGALEVGSPHEVGVISVTVDGVPRGAAPLRVDSLAPGVHELRFAGAGVEPWGETVDIRVGETREVVAHAVGSPATGVLQVKGTATDERGAEPLKGAQVWIDGEPRGTTPLSLDLPRGPHSVRAAYRGQDAPIQVIDLPGGNQRFAVFEFGLDVEVPKVIVDLPPRLPRDRATVVSASVQGIAASELREMWLHAQTPGGPWRGYQMTLLNSAGGVTGVVPFPTQAFDAQGSARYYVSAAYGQGDEAFTEIRTIQLEKPPAH